MPAAFEGLLSLRRRVRASCEVELLEPLHLGAGKDPTSPIDLIISRDSAGRPIIPGSSLKGFFRSYLSRMLLGMSATGTSSLPFGSKAIRLEPCIDSISERKRDLNSIDKLCLIDRLFGYAGSKFSLSSRVRFTDAKPTGAPSGIVRTHVSIDRERDAAERGMLVHVEAVDGVNKVGGASKFSFQIIFDELSDPRFENSNLLFYYMLKMLERGIRDFIGGWKSRGYGYCKIMLNELETASIQDLIQGNVRKLPLDDLLREVGI